MVELFNPTYDEAMHTATYDLAVLADWLNDIEMGFQKAPTDSSDLTAGFGATHLFIDDCSDRDIDCCNFLDRPVNDPRQGYLRSFFGQGMCYWWSLWQCVPCTPNSAQDIQGPHSYATQMCNQSLSGCNGNRCESQWNLNGPGH